MSKDPIEELSSLQRRGWHIQPEGRAVILHNPQLKQTRTLLTLTEYGGVFDAAERRALSKIIAEALNVKVAQFAGLEISDNPKQHPLK